MSIKMQIGCNETQQRKAATPTIRKPSVACGTSFFGAAVVNDLVKFKERSQSVIAKRHAPCPNEVQEVSHTRDFFQGDSIAEREIAKGSIHAGIAKRRP